MNKTILKNKVSSLNQSIASMYCVLLNTIEIVNQLNEGVMDKKIKKVKKSLDKKMDMLVKEDKPRDKKLKKCSKIMMMKPKKKV